MSADLTLFPAGEPRRDDTVLLPDGRRALVCEVFTTDRATYVNACPLGTLESVIRRLDEVRLLTPSEGAP